MKLTAVIFDLDGTVLSNEDEWGRAFGTVLNELGIKNVPFFPHIGGIGIKENWPYLINKYNIKTDKNLDELATLTKKEYEKLIPKVTLNDGYQEFVQKLKASGVVIALATSSTWDSVEKIFDIHDIERDYDCVTTGEEVSVKKPDPEIFLITAEKLGLPPSECLVIEDSVAGIKAARRAGMKVVGLYRNDSHKKSLKNADLLVDDFRDLTLEAINDL